MYDCLVVLKHVGLHRLTLTGCFIKQGHIADSIHRHVERTRYRRCGKREQVDIGGGFLKLFLLADTEALLLVNYKKPEVAEFYFL